MPTTAQILRLLHTMANELAWLAIAWHVIVVVVIVAMMAGWRPSRRTGGLLLAALLVSVSASSFAYGNPFNGVSFGALATLLAASARRPGGTVVAGRPWAFLSGAALVAYGCGYPAFASGAWYHALYIAPVGVVPCPTLAVAAGFTLMAGGFGSRVIPRLLALWSAFYAVFGIFGLDVVLDAGLFAAALVLVVAPRRPRAPGRRALAAALATIAGCQVAPDLVSPMDRPIGSVWPALNRWDERLEREYSEFVAAIGDAVERRRCGTLAACLRDPQANITYEPGVDARLRLQLDCADLPYVLRAYFAFKRRLPFGFVARTHGTGEDMRYAVGMRPVAFRDWRDYATPRAVLRAVVGTVHTGMYRIAGEVDDGDFYPVHIDREAVRPGAIYYDPNGHVMAVARVREDGAVYVIDGHPDGSLTWTRFGGGFAIGTARLGGGFKAFRPQRLVDGEIVRARNHELPAYDGHAQYDRSLHVVGGARVEYHAWVRASLATSAAPIDPFREVREQVQGLCRDVGYRVDAVEAAMAAGLAARPHPGALPWNIYGTDGDWEIYSTPSRDARLKAAFRELDGFVGSRPELRDFAPAFGAIWSIEAASAGCRFSYRDSRGRAVAFGLDAVLDRLFALSFDPYHCPERRWGAPDGSTELASCIDDAVKQRWYEAEARLRNRIDRDYGVATPLDAGPAEAPAVDVRRRFGRQEVAP